jgi:hypothetical protein
MTATERDAISSPATGLMVYVTDDNLFWYYDGTQWTVLNGLADNLGNHTAEQNIKTNGYWISNDGDNEGIYIYDNGWVGIGTNNTPPSATLHIKGDDADIQLNINSSSTTANLVEYRLAVDDEIRSNIYYDKRDSILYIEQRTPALYPGSGKIRFRAGNIPAMTVNHDGKIGINQDDPVRQLDVNGFIKHGKALYFYSDNIATGREWVRFSDTDNEYGDNLFIGSGAVTAIGGGESAIQIKNNVDNDNGHETLYLGSDVSGSSLAAVRIITGLQSGWDYRVEAITVLGNGNTGYQITDPKGTIHLKYKYDAGTNSSYQKSDLVIGAMNDTHLEIDDNEIHAMSNGTTPHTLYLNADGGLVSIHAHTYGPALTLNVGGATFALNLPNSSNNGIGRARANAWFTYSDSRLKTGVQEIDNALEIIEKMKPVSYFQHNSTFINKGETDDTITGIRIENDGENSYGFIAQELYRVLPEAVYKPADESTDLWGINYQLLIPILTQALKEQQKQIEELREEIRLLKKAKTTEIN